MKKILIVLLTVMAAVASFGQTINDKKLDSLFDILGSKNLAIGSVAVSQNGKVVYRRSFGKGQTAATTSVSDLSQRFSLPSWSTN
jgi:sulfur carrier protein ThiS